MTDVPIIEGDDLICVKAQGGCGEPFNKGGRAIILTGRQLQRIMMSDGDLSYTEFENQSGLFCRKCLKELETHGGQLARHSSRGEYLVSFAWMMRRTYY